MRTNEKGSPRVGSVTEALWGARVSASTVSELNQKIYAQIESWRNRPIEGEHAYVFLDGIWLKRCWGGEVKNVAVLVAIGVASDGYREITSPHPTIRRNHRPKQCTASVKDPRFAAPAARPATVTCPAAADSALVFTALNEMSCVSFRPLSLSAKRARNSRLS